MKMDEADYIAFTETLEADITALETSLREAGKDVPPRPQVRRNDLIEATETLEGHRAALKTLCNVAGLKVQLTPAKPQKENHMTTAKTEPGSTSSSWTEKAKAAKRLQADKPKSATTYTGYTARAVAARQPCMRGMPPEPEND